MPVPIRETPLARALYEEGREEGERLASVRFTALLLRRRFGDDPRVDEVAARLADVADDRRLDLIASAAALDDLLSEA